MTTCIIRPATLDDCDAIGQVHVAAWQWAYAGLMSQDVLDGLDPTARADNWRRMFGQDDFAPPFVAVRDDAIVGFAHMSASRDEDEGAAAGEVTSIYIDKSVLGSGVGAELWRAAIEWLAQHGHDSVSVWVLSSNTRGREFYERMGLAFDGTVKSNEVRCELLPHMRYQGPISSHV